MNKFKNFTPIVFIPILLSACATTPKVSPMEQMIAAGGEIVDTRELIGDTGVTFFGTDGAWINYLGAEGRKVVKINKSGLIKELSWRLNDAGRFCQQMFATEKEKCDSHVLIKDMDGNYHSYEKDSSKSGLSFSIASGNPEGL